MNLHHDIFLSGELNATKPIAKTQMIMARYIWKKFVKVGLGPRGAAKGEKCCL